MSITHKRLTFRGILRRRAYVAAEGTADIGLAHFIGSDVERAYQRSDMLDRRREMMLEWGAFLSGKSTQNEKVTRIA